ncbi:MAG: hypothetical protein DRP47_08125 [Candidatus Zixiibacteriota bacterium]|nr:MAG: hypothetical protein DRP47_08125 [candidate division Zixibacteria bacterium]
MFILRTVAVMSLIGLLLFAVLGCSDDDATPTGTTGDNDNNETVEFTQFEDLVKLYAPQVYVGPSGAPQGECDSIWTDGSHPLLGKVFGEDEPMSLYWNVDELDGAIETLADIMENADSMGISGDTSVTMPEGGTFTLQTLTSATSIPTQCQAIIGCQSVNLEQLVKFHFVGTDFSVDYHIGYSSTDSNQTYLTYFTAPNEGTGTESFLYYAYIDLYDSSIVIKGVFFKDYGDQTSARWVYHIESVDTSDFSYRMSWYADNFGGQSGLGCIIGGGNKDEQFAMKFRQYTPADNNVVDSSYILNQMFDGDYNYLSDDIATGYEEFVEESNIFTYDDMPSALLSSPWAN